MNPNKNIPYYLIAVGIFLLLKFGYTFAENYHLGFLLKPTDKLIGILTGSYSIYFSDKGYYHEYLNIVIDKSCSGFNFWILSFLLFTYLILNYSNTFFLKILTIPIAIIGSYILTIFSNTSRIFTSIIIQYQTGHILKNQQAIIHESIGITTNLTFLILSYLLIEKLLIYRQNNAKFT